MSRVALDVRMWAHPGIGRYIRELTRQLVELSGTDSFTFLGDEIQLGEFAFNDRVRLRPAHAPIYSILEQFEILSKVHGADLLHAPHFNIPVLYRGPLVVTIHDLLYLHDAKASKSRFGGQYLRFLLKQIEKKSAMVLTVSEYTKRDLLGRFPGIKEERVVVTHEAASTTFRQTQDPAGREEIKKKYSLWKPFVLCVGTLKPHKNISLLVQTMKQLRRRGGIEQELVLVGRKDPRNTAILTEIFEEGSFVHYLGEIPDEELVFLYNMADALVLPSLWEGFGLPVLEAMACGCPVISSDRTSLPEIVGDAGLLFDPMRVDALEEHLYNVLQNNELRQKMRHAGLERAKHFSWKKTAEETLNVYRRLIS